MTGNHGHFQTGSGVYTCNSCGKRTRETGSCESGTGMCRACFDEAGEENTHLDTHDEPVEGCKWCEDQSDS